MKIYVTVYLRSCYGEVDLSLILIYIYNIILGKFKFPIRYGLVYRVNKVGSLEKNAVIDSGRICLMIKI